MSVQANNSVDASAIDNGVRRIIVEELGVEIQTIRPDTDIISDLGADKTDMDAIKTATEQKFHIKISDENWEKMRCIRDITHLVDVYIEIKQIEM